MKLNKKLEKLLDDSVYANNWVNKDLTTTVIKQLILKEIMKNAPTKIDIYKEQKKLDHIEINIDMTMAGWTGVNEAIDQYTKAIEELLTIQEGKK